MNRKITPKGLRINLSVNLIDPSTSTVMNDIAKISAMAESEITLSVLRHYQAIVQQTKDTSSPTSTVAHFQEKLRLSEEYITKYQQDFFEKKKKEIHALVHGKSTPPNQKTHLEECKEALPQNFRQNPVLWESNQGSNLSSNYLLGWDNQNNSFCKSMEQPSSVYPTYRSPSEPSPSPKPSSS